MLSSSVCCLLFFLVAVLSIPEPNPEDIHINLHLQGLDKVVSGQEQDLEVQMCDGENCPPKLTWNDYHPLQHHQEYLHYLYREFPHIAQVEKIGVSHENRPILLLKICPNRKCGEKPAIWIDGGIHGREWISPAAVAYLAKELVVRNEAHKRVTNLFDWYLLTVANPDGYSQTFSGHRMWRKNKNPKYAQKCKNSYGVDLNRNFGYFWADNRTNPNNPCSNNYHGEAEFSEPESRAIRDFLLKLRGEIAIFNTVHAAGEKFVIPWGHTDEPFKHEGILTELLKAGRSAMGKHGERFTIGNVKKSYGIVAHGGSVNWAAGVLGLKFPICTELVHKAKHGQTPPANLILTEVEGFVKFSLAIANKAQEILYNRRNIRRRS